MPDEPKYLTKSEAAEILRCTTRTLDRTRSLGGEPRSFKRGKGRLYPLADLERWVENKLKKG